MGCLRASEPLVNCGLPATRHLGLPPVPRNAPEWDAFWASEPLVN